MPEDLLLTNERVLSKTINDSIIFTNRRILLNPNSSRKQSILVEAINRIEIREKGVQLLPIAFISIALAAYFAFNDHFDYAGASMMMAVVFFLIQKLNSKKVLIISAKKTKDLVLKTSQLRTDARELLNQMETARFERFNQSHASSSSDKEVKVVKISA